MKSKATIGTTTTIASAELATPAREMLHTDRQPKYFNNAFTNAVGNATQRSHRFRYAGFHCTLQRR
jgi:hypothetical protein